MHNTTTITQADAERLAELRSQCRAGPVTLDQAAATLGMPAQDLMAGLIVTELMQKPLAAAIVAGAEGAVIVKRAADGELQLTMPVALATIVLAGILCGDPTAQASICVPLPPATGSEEVN